MLLDLFKYLSTIAKIAVLLNVLLLFWKFKSIPDKIRILWPYLVVALITEIISKMLQALNQPNLYLLHIYTLLEFLAWSFFYKRVFQDKTFFQKIFPWAITIVSALIIGNTIFLEPITGFNSNAKTLVQLILISYAVYFLFNAFGKIDLSKPVQRATVFINFAVILYYSGSLFIFMFSKLLSDQHVAYRLQHGFWIMNSLLVVLFQILIFISLWTVAFNKKTS